MLNTKGKYNLTDIRFLLPVNPDDTVLLIGENDLLAEGLSKLCKKVIKKTISSLMEKEGMDEGSVDLIIFDDIKKDRLKDKGHYMSCILGYPSSEWVIASCILKDGGHICLSVFNLWMGGYSCGRINRDLIEAGFKDIENYAVVPTHLNPKFIITIKDISPLIYYISHHFERDSFFKRMVYMAVRLSATAGIFKYIVPSYIITARKKIKR